MIDRDEVRRLLRRAHSRLEGCVASESRARARTLLVRFAIHDTGRPGTAIVNGGMPASNACVNRVIRGMTFPPSQVADAVVRLGITLSPN